MASPVTDTADVAVKSAVRKGAAPSPAHAAGSISRPVPSAMARRKASGTSRAGCWSVRGNVVPFTIRGADRGPALFRYPGGLQAANSRTSPTGNNLLSRACCRIAAHSDRLGEGGGSHLLSGGRSDSVWRACLVKESHGPLLPDRRTPPGFPAPRRHAGPAA